MSERRIDVNGRSLRFRRGAVLSRVQPSVILSPCADRARR
jgi:hypothetical protein